MSTWYSTFRQMPSHDSHAISIVASETKGGSLLPYPAINLLLTLSTAPKLYQLPG